MVFAAHGLLLQSDPIWRGLKLYSSLYGENCKLQSDPIWRGLKLQIASLLSAACITVRPDMKGIETFCFWIVFRFLNNYSQTRYEGDWNSLEMKSISRKKRLQSDPIWRGLKRGWLHASESHLITVRPDMKGIETYVYVHTGTSSMHYSQTRYEGDWNRPLYVSTWLSCALQSDPIWRGLKPYFLSVGKQGVLITVRPDMKGIETL